MYKTERIQTIHHVTQNYLYLINLLCCQYIQYVLQCYDRGTNQ